MSLFEHYRLEIRPALQRDGFGNVNAVPRVLKITLNVGIGKNAREDKAREAVVGTLTRIAGQKPVITKAKTSISSFKVRAGMPVGVVVTLRGKRMWDFLEKLVRVTFPRMRDFRGLEDKLVDRQGNMSVGFREHLVFPEIRPDEVEQVHGVQVTITTNAHNRERGLKLFRALGFPFKFASESKSSKKK